MDKRIAILSTTTGFTAKTRVVLRDRSLGFPIHEAALNDAVKLAAKLEAEGTKVFITRGGTAELIRRVVQVPVVTVKYTYFDFAYAMEAASRISKKIAVFGFQSTAREAEKFRRFSGEETEITLVMSEEEIDERMARFASDGIEVVIGGLSVAQAAARHGLKSVMYEIDQDSIAEAIDEALYMLKVEEDRQERLQTISSILNCASEGIVGIDADGRITTINGHARKLLADAGEGQDIRKVIPHSNIMEAVRTGVPVAGELVDTWGTPVAINAMPITANGRVIGVVATLQEVDDIQEIEKKIRTKLRDKGHFARKAFDDIIGSSAALAETKARAMRFARNESTILLHGETGTGKELFAQSIHNYSLRAQKPFIAINCAAIPASLLESELFGYVKGAFTGARSEGKAGIFETAHTGTIFLDEIGEITPDVQVRLLRVLQEKEVTRIGDDKVIPVDVRVLAATNKDLLSEVRAGRFREDLYYRLCVLELRLPPLRDRREDVFELVSHFIEAKRSRFPTRENWIVSDAALLLLRDHDWQGNIRQLDNAVERLMVMSDDGMIDERLVREALGLSAGGPASDSASSVPPSGAVEEPASPSGGSLLDIAERELILRALSESNGDKALAAKRLGISPTTLWRRLKTIQYAPALPSPRPA